MKKKMKGSGLILISLVAILSFGCYEKTQEKQPLANSTVGSVKYTCPMHPQILEDHAGDCPICGMKLVKKSGQESKSAGISLTTVLQPVNSSVIASIPSITPKDKEIPTEISADGYLDFDTRTFNNIAARFSGRVEKLYIKYAFQEIHRGQRIFDIYSPDMVTAQQDLLYLVKNSPQETALINAARQKLLLLGMTTGQINRLVKTGKQFYSLPVYSPYDGHVHDVAHSQMSGATDTKLKESYSDNLPLAIKEGMYVEKGQTIFNVVDPHRLWAIIKVNPSTVSTLKLRMPVKITLTDLPGKVITGRVDFIEPVIQSGDKSTSVRVYVDNMHHDLKVNSLIKATIQTGTASGFWIPQTALADLGRTQIVWLKSGSIFKAHEVKPGAKNNGEIQITKGLAATDSIAINAQYLTDSESFIKTQRNEK